MQFDDNDDSCAIDYTYMKRQRHSKVILRPDSQAATHSTE